MTNLMISETAAFLLEQECCTILTHRRPDGDTVGSAIALCRGLRALGKEAVIYENPQFTPRYLPYLAGLTGREVRGTVVAVDIAAEGLFPMGFSGVVDLCIDHHGSNSGYAARGHVEGDRAACGEILYDVLRAMDVTVDKAMADALYIAITTDTGCFRYSNTTAHTFETAAMCAAAGARIYELNQALFETNTLGKLKMQGWIVENMKMLAEGKMAICAIPRSVEEELGVTPDDMDNISSFPRTVAGVCVAATLRETADGDTKISVRAVPGYDAAKVTEKFGGGGHKGAAGASLKMSLAEAALAVEKAMLELGEDHGRNCHCR